MTALDLNKVVSYSLRVGVLVSAVLSLLGLVLWGARGFSVLQPAIVGISGIVNTALSGNETGIIYLGVVILIATPIFRVAISSLYFASEKDRKYVVITLVVLAMLGFALLSGAGA